MEKIENIIIHCSASNWGTARLIRQWHLQRGWKDIGYHFVILNGFPSGDWYNRRIRIFAQEGSVEGGREINPDNILDLTEIGAHALGYNSKSIGICLIGDQKFRPAQLMALWTLVNQLRAMWGIPIGAILGHYETPQGRKEGKTCPNLQMAEIRDYLLSARDEAGVILKQMGRLDE